MLRENRSSYPEPLYRGKQANQAFKDYLSEGSNEILKYVEELLARVPCTTYAQLRFLEVLAGRVVPIGASLDIGELAQKATDDMQYIFCIDNEQDDAGIRYPGEGVELDETDLEKLALWDKVRWTLVRDSLYFQVLHLYQRIYDIGISWKPNGKIEPKRMAASNTSDAGIMDSSQWPDLKTLALFIALRRSANEPIEEDLSSDAIADHFASLKGFPGKASGKRLRRYILDYRNVDGRLALGTRNTEVLKRYTFMLSKLQEWPKAMELAEKERELLLTRG